MSRGKHKTVEEQAFSDWLHDQPCYACLQLGARRPAEQHHKATGYKREGEKASCPLCEWHHRGIPVISDSAKITEIHLGPSLARNKRAFVSRFGTERELIAMANERWEAYRAGSAP